MRGGTSDGNDFIDAAIRKGAAAVVTDSLERFVDLRTQQPELALALVDREANGGRRALAEISSAVFGGSGEKTEDQRGYGDEREDDDGVSAGADAKECGAEVRAARDD